MPEKTITITVKLFAIYQEIYNQPELTLTVADNTTVTDIFHLILTEHPELSTWQTITRFAINMEFVASDTRLQDGDELVLIPPVSGG
jgi:molybdopterin synthase sulfur carrier subunit